MKNQGQSGDIQSAANSGGVSGDGASGSSAPRPAAQEVERQSPQNDSELIKSSLLACRGIRRAFTVGDRKLEILHGVDMRLCEGEVVALVGSSGAGKSTLLHVLGLLDRPTEGTVFIDGEDAWAKNTQQRANLRNKRIGFVFQFYHLLPELTALQNVLLPAMIAEGNLSWRKRKSEYLQRAESLLVRFGMADRLTHKPPQLSGGERQRVALARALFLNPGILIADEPTGNLDRATGEKVLDLLFAEQERRQITLLLVTHDNRLADRCQRTLRMEDGLIVGDSRLLVPD